MSNMDENMKLKFCTDEEENMKVTRIESEEWPNLYFYNIVCSKCGKNENLVFMQPRQPVMICGDIETKLAK